MATNNSVIKEALSILGVLDEIQSVSAEQGENGLSVMNDMLLEWDADQIDVGYYPQTDINAESPIYPDALAAVKHNLAIYLASYYGLEPKGPVLMIADRGYKRLLRDAMNAKIQEANMQGVPLGEAFITRNNILSG